MSTQAEAPTAIIDILKQVSSVVLVIAGLSAFYYFSEVQLVYRVVGLLLIMAIAAGAVLTTAFGRIIWDFVLESKVEVRKVVWPSKDETTRTTLLVFAMVFVVGLILWVLDMFLFWGVRLLTGEGG
ncbi:MAG: preprotein translocase subunit SecE [Methylococcaceae bacterium]|nr:preprotein translocase subunit SecE [Methylococcaceae bacterium]